MKGVASVMNEGATSKRGKPGADVPRRSKAIRITRESVHQTLEMLAAIHPDAHCELVHKNAFELLVATVLSAQTTDVAVNKATPALFEQYPDAKALAAAEPSAIEPILSRIGMFRQKSKNIVGLARKIVAEHHGEVPRSLAQLVELPGVGRKTANVVLGVAFNAPEGVVVDTHVQRISQRLGWTKNTEPAKIEQDLCNLLPREDWDRTSHILIFHGRRICFARKPTCEACGVNTVCPSAFEAEKVGRKPKRARGPVVKATPNVKSVKSVKSVESAKKRSTKTNAAKKIRGTKSVAKSKKRVVR